MGMQWHLRQAPLRCERNMAHARLLPHAPVCAATAVGLRFHLSTGHTCRCVSGAQCGNMAPVQLWLRTDCHAVTAPQAALQPLAASQKADLIAAHHELEKNVQALYPFRSRRACQARRGRKQLPG